MLLIIKICSLAIYLTILIPLLFSNMFIAPYKRQVNCVKMSIYDPDQAERQIRNAARKLQHQEQLMLLLPSLDNIDDELFYIVWCLQRKNPSLLIQYSANPLKL